ncbi:phosphonate metabolism transcriptional regulator PhnF [Azospirillum sp. ST 5-10]|uniref:phosphonate metabolism transcriptional regulator PhnF n=1 Tax=unclassified Azospirillum TaxID=2630922 RepID=UPI003F4A426C
MTPRGAGPPLWRRIADSLSQEIEAGTHGAEERLPSEGMLAARFGVNRHTVRRAMAALAEDGVVRVEHGRGTFVQPHRVEYAVGRRTRFSANVRGQNRRPAWELLRADIVPAGPALAEALALASQTPVIVLETLGRIDGRPVALSDHRSPAERFPRLIDAFRSEGSITAALRRHGVGDYTRRTTRLTARMPDAREADLLRLPRGVPVLVSEAVNVDADGVPIQWSHTRFAANQIEIVVEAEDPTLATADAPGGLASR